MKLPLQVEAEQVQWMDGLGRVTAGLHWTDDLGPSLWGKAWLNLQGVPEKVKVGPELEYRFKVKNHGPDAATSVTAQFMCSGVAYHLMDASSGCAVTGSSVMCSLGTLRDDRSVTGEIVIVPDAAGVLSCTASVSSATPDPVLTNQSDTEGTRVRR